MESRLIPGKTEQESLEIINSIRTNPHTSNLLGMDIRGDDYDALAQLRNEIISKNGLDDNDDTLYAIEECINDVLVSIGAPRHYVTSDGLSVDNYDPSCGYRVGDTIDGAAIEYVVNEKNGSDTLFIRVEQEDESVEYQYVSASCETLESSCAGFGTLDDALSEFFEHNLEYFQNNDRLPLLQYYKRELTKGPDNPYLSDRFNEVFANTDFYEKYDTLNKSYDTYKDGDGWGNALFHYFNYTPEDWNNFVEWVDEVYGAELELQNQNEERLLCTTEVDGNEPTGMKI